jgi:uncharacterized membrane protein YdbT with pleckstrin-like domain
MITHIELVPLDEDGEGDDNDYDFPEVVGKKPRGISNVEKRKSPAAKKPQQNKSEGSSSSDAAIHEEIDQSKAKGKKAEAEPQQIKEHKARPVAVAVQRTKPAEKIEWVIFISCCLCIFMFLLVLLGYLSNYDNAIELARREDMDQMTVVSITIVMISVVFGFLAFFH